MHAVLAICMPMFVKPVRMATYMLSAIALLNEPYTTSQPVFGRAAGGRVSAHCLGCHPTNAVLHLARLLIMLEVWQKAIVRGGGACLRTP